MSSERLTMAIYGLGCGGGGALTVERALQAVPGVARAYVNPATEMAYLVYDGAITDQGRLTAAVSRVGFAAGELRMHGVRSAASMPATAPDDESAGRRAEQVAAASDAENQALNVIGRAPHTGSRRWPVRPPSPVLLTVLLAMLPLALAAGLWVIHLLNVSGPEAAPQTIELSSAGIVPAELVVQAGRPTSLLLVNKERPSDADTGAHRFAVARLGIDVRLVAGQSQLISFTAPEPGAYTFYCDLCCRGSDGQDNAPMQGLLLAR